MRKHHLQGMRNHRAKLTNEEVVAIRQARRHVGRCPPGHPASIAALAERYGITRAQVSKIARGVCWMSVAGGRT